MKVVIVNTSERTGGAAVAANRLMKALRKSGIDASMLVRDKQSDDENVISVNTSWVKRKINFIRFVWERIVIFINNGFDRKNLFAVSIANTGTDISKLPIIKNADIIHIHWINQGFLSLKDIQKLVQTGKPIVWTMHDMWPCTGICHHAHECTSYIEQCGNCYYLNSNSKEDLSHTIWKKKQNVSYKNIQFVAVSNWLQDILKMSSLTNASNSQTIPNLIDINLFNPIDKKIARKELGWKSDTKIILMGAAKLNDPIKGFNYLRESISFLTTYTEEESYLIVLFGEIKDNPNFLSDLPVPYVHLGVLSDVKYIAQLYQAADITVVPSLYETFGQTIIEAMACGCPVVSFNNSGQTDIIDHKKNGYLAEYKSSEDLAKGIHWTLFEADYNLLSKKAREKVADFYSEKIVANKYEEMYKEFIYDK